MIHRILTPLIFLTVATTATARDATPQEKQDLFKAATELTIALHEKDVIKVVNTLPPSLIKQAMESSGQTKKEVLKDLDKEASKLLRARDAGVVSIDAFNTEYRALDDGTPYALVPYEIHLDTKTAYTVIRGSYVGILEDGKWYFIRLQEPKSFRSFREDYPAFANEDLPYPLRSDQLKPQPLPTEVQVQQ